MNDVGWFLVSLAALIYILSSPVGRWLVGVVLFAIAFVILVALSGCSVPVELECEVERVGKFTTTDVELRRDHDLVKMRRGDRVFYWERDRIVVCREL